MLKTLIKEWGLDGTLLIIGFGATLLHLLVTDKFQKSWIKGVIYLIIIPVLSSYLGEATQVSLKWPEFVSRILTAVIAIVVYDLALDPFAFAKKIVSLKSSWKK